MLLGLEGPSPSAVAVMVAVSKAGVRVGSALRINAPTAPACGAAADVPKNGVGNPPAPVTDTPSGATSSGFTRPSSVGPRELKGSIAAGVCQGTAPVEMTNCASPTFGTLLSGTMNSFITPPRINTSKTRGAALPWTLMMPMPSVPGVDAVRVMERASVGFALPFCLVVEQNKGARGTSGGSYTHKS